jgi:hypothetical protein
VRKLSVVGAANSVIPIDYDSEIWIVPTMLETAHRKTLKRFDKVFEVHDDQTVSRLSSEYLKIETETIVCRHDSEFFKPFRNKFIYPLIEVMDAVYLQHERYLTSTMAYMLAYALYLDCYDHIELAQVHCSAWDEYAAQRPCLEYLIGVARERGVIVKVPADSELLYSPYLYGYEKRPIGREKLEARYKYLYQTQSGIIEQLKMEISKQNQMIGYLKAMQDIDSKPATELENTKEQLSGQLNITSQIVKNLELDLSQMIGSEMMLNYISDITGGRNA